MLQAFIELLLAIFFFTIGMELRETSDHPKDAIAPALAALGGMVVPAAIFLLFSPDKSAWATVMPTDVALGLGVFALLGKRISPAVRKFLLTLAIADDALSLITMAVFYGEKLNVAQSLSTLGATALGLVAAGFKFVDAEKLLKFLAPFSTFVVIPIYVLHTFWGGINFGPRSNAVLIVFITSRVLGKVIGISTFGLLARKSGARFQIQISQLVGIGLISGMGLTVSLVISNLAVSQQSVQSSVEIGLIVSALISGLIGYLWFLALSKEHSA